MALATRLVSTVNSDASVREGWPASMVLMPWLAVLAGGTVSDAVYEIMMEGQVGNPWQHCERGVPSTWEHAVWHCPAFADGKPPMPRDFLQKGLGWPTASQHLEQEDEAVLMQMVHGGWFCCKIAGVMPPEILTREWVAAPAISLIWHR